MCLEVLTRMLLLKEEKNGNLHGIKIAISGPTVSHLMYADDLLIMCRANRYEVAVVKRCFDNYCSWSRQEANLQKSNILFPKNCNRTKKKKEILEATVFKEMGNNAVYLGNYLVFSRNRLKEFKFLKERVHQRLEGWNQQLLSKAKKATLIKTMIQAIPIYSMSTFNIPLGTCRTLDSMVKCFW